MTFDLTVAETRVLGCLIEKESTTPDQYPLSTNSLRSAVNQKTSRDPVLDLSEYDIDAAMLALRDRGLARSLRPSGSRAWKHRHVVDEVLPLGPGEKAVVAVLLLRGAQTSGELRTRTERIHAFPNAEAVDTVLAQLATAPKPYVRNIGRSPGQSQDRFEHCLSDAHESQDTSRQRALFHRFVELHETGCFLVPNPWDRGSALHFQRTGAPALATTSSGFARSMGKQDQQVSRDELVDHVSELTAVLDSPLTVDSEVLYPQEPGGIVRTVQLLAQAGAAGCSIEDYDPTTRSILPIAEATSRVAEAVEACAQHQLVLTARAENYLYGSRDFDDTLQRLQSFAEAGAAVLYAPGLEDPTEIELVTTSCERPVNVLLRPNGPSISELERLGVRRISVGGALQMDAYDYAEARVRDMLAPPPSA